ncbi:NPCBM/NEW2 domain-containing protein [Streptomyces microflavus]|uniref:NPCBM/NEW2 domain-containing protein n=2 Tax=Streptomyces microflavus subgroup TaxID=1482601 RepID=A0A7H8N178_STRMI|nr:NPCBM/NEW2 domain-containing protein [Streptomyces microflavus]QKW48162.1 NPCBM/NEW2 domain-containing protein [Streptomyces microflavus]
MSQHENGQGEGLPARRQAREDRDRIKAAFGTRLRVLLDLTGLSSREFAARFPAYKDSTVRKYTLGTNLPPWDFLNDLLTEVARRTDDPAAPQRRTELFTAYRDTLVRTGATTRGSDQNSLLLRLLDGEEALRRIVDELAEVRARETQLRSDLEEEARRAGPAPTPESDARQHRLEEEGLHLAQRRDALVERRSALVGDLDRCRELLGALEAADGGEGSGGGGVIPPRPDLPPALSSGVGGGSARRRVAWVAGGAVAAVLLAGGGVMAGIWYMQGDVRESRQDARGAETTGASGPVSPSSTPAPAPTSGLPSSEGPSVGESAGASASASLPPSKAPVFVPPSGRTWSLVRDVAPMDDGTAWKYETGKVRVNTKDYPTTLQAYQASGTWQLDRKYTSLVTRLGVSDTAASGDSVVFTVEVDDEVVREITMGPGQDAESMTIDLRGAFRVTLKLHNPSVGLTVADGAWIDPVLTK